MFSLQVYFNYADTQGSQFSFSSIHDTIMCSLCKIKINVRCDRESNTTNGAILPGENHLT